MKISEGIDINKSNKSKEVWSAIIIIIIIILNLYYKYEPEVCNRCLDILMMAYELENIKDNTECRRHWF